jgi:flagellar biogenesis protein FliO
MDVTNGPVDQLVAMNSQIVQYIAVLLALVGVLVLAYVTLKVGLPRIFGMHTSGTGPIRVLARYPLEPKKTLYLVETGSQVFLLASSESGVTYLTPVEAVNAAEMFDVKPAAQPPHKEFRRLLAWFQRSNQSQ